MTRIEHEIQCERCAYYDGNRFGPAACLIIEEDPNAGAAYGGGCRYFCDVGELASADEEPCFRKREEDGSWRCVFEINTTCLWNDGQGACLHEHPSSPAPLMEPEE
jgi:hypothetical protein